MQPADPDGDGTPSVKLSSDDLALGQSAKERLMSDLDSDPTTGADLGAGPGAGAITGESANGGDLPENPPGARKTGNGGSSSKSTTGTRRRS
jgi:Mn-containing catalase